ncbi:MAG: N-formylglutamate amidohydrolase [Pseudomonadota bacterium]
MIREAQGELSQVLFASPHSGTVYPEAMQRDLRVPLLEIRRTEDAFVDELFEIAPDLGATLVSARYGRGFVDLNRDARELDPSMFSDGAPRASGLPTARVEAGLGCLPRICSRGREIYARRMTKSEGERRLADVHDSYHGWITQTLAALRERHGEAVLIDCHSMPSSQPGRRGLPDIVLGDRFGSSCSARLTGLVERTFKSMGYSVTRNAPYAGGYTTRRYGRPRRGTHALQIEINRSLYMDESSLSPHAGFDTLRDDISAMCRTLVDFCKATAAA